MSELQHADVAVVGAGIVGLAHAYAAARQGYKVVLFERNNRAVGASVRNFGLVWPIGQPAGPRYERALRSRATWREAAARAGFWCAENGSLHLAHRADEEDVLVEFLETNAVTREACALLSPAEVAERSPVARQEGLRCALWSPYELNVDPRQAIRALPAWLEREYGVGLRFGSLVCGIAMPFVETAQERWRVDRVFVCSGADFETLYPAAFTASGITRCKLQMLRTAPQPTGWRLGPSLCAGLTLLHYAAFSHCRTLAALRRRVEAELPFYVAERIHVLLSQTALGELTIGDHHEYGLTVEPFDRSEVEQAILDELLRFARFPVTQVAERWHGVYPALPGQSELVLYPAAGVTVVNGLGGAGMTLAFGLADELV